MADTSPRLVKRRALQEALGVSVDTLRRYLERGKIPPPSVDLGPGQQWWHPADLEAAGIRLRPAEASASQPTPEASASAPA